MDSEKIKYDTPKHQVAGEPGSAGAASQSTLERGAEVYGQAEQVVSDVYDKPAQTASEADKQATSNRSKNTGKIILVSLALVIGIGLGFLFYMRYRRSHTARLAQLVVKALPDISREILRKSELLAERALQQMR